MILITGGAYQGKTDTAKSLYVQRRKDQHRSAPVVVDGENGSMEQLCQADIITHFHLWIRRLAQKERNPYPMVEQLLNANPHVIVTLTQLGCGVVPIEKFDRQYREITGRIGCLLAEQAEEVYLVNYGIAKRIKSGRCIKTADRSDCGS